MARDNARRARYTFQRVYFVYCDRCNENIVERADEMMVTTRREAEHTGKDNGRDYGIFVMGRRSLGQRRTVYAHRFAYELLVGPIAPGLQIDHLCRVRRCVNPAHMEQVTSAENTRRAGAAVTHCIRGHEFTPQNTYRQPSTGRRSCVTCRQMHADMYRQARLAVAS